LHGEELAQKGQPPAPEELCRDCPELLPEVQRHIEEWRSLQRFLGVPDERTATGDFPQTASFSETASPPPVVGELPCRFGRYLLQKRLGEGGMGTVYLARDTTLDRPVALKIAKGQDQDEAVMLERFRREAKAAAALRHEGLCRVM